MKILFVSKTSWRRLQLNNFFLLRRFEDVFKTFQDALRDVFKTSSRRLGRRKIVTLNSPWRRVQEMSWRRLQNFLQTNKYLLGCLQNAFRLFILNIKGTGTELLVNKTGAAQVWMMPVKNSRKKIGACIPFW